MIDLAAIRATAPESIGVALATRRRRPLGSEKLLIVAADHPARGALGIGADPLAMANRHDLLERLATALERPGVDGVLATPDIIDDLALLGLLDDRIVVGSMNRGGLRGASFEMDDRYTAYDVPSMVASGVDFAKTLVRINLADAATAATLESTAHAVTAAAAAHLPIMLEPFISSWVDGRIVNDLSTDAVVHSAAIASGLGASSAYTWLKLPVVDDMDAVLAATTLPVLLLGGEVSADQGAQLATWSKALANPVVRGMIVGRSLLFPPTGTVEEAVDATVGLMR